MTIADFFHDGSANAPRIAAVTLIFVLSVATAIAGEYIGQFDTALVHNPEDMDQIVFKNSEPVRWRDLGAPEGSHFSTAQLQDPITGHASLLAVLLEIEDEDPVLYVDQNDDNRLSKDEKIALSESDNPYIWEATFNIPMKGGFFTSYPVFVQYFKSFRTGKMSDADRLVRQSTQVLARGSVDVNGRKVVVQYEVVDKKVNPRDGWLGMDTDGDGKVDMDGLSPEAAKASNESVVFRVGDLYLSTKKADVGKNQIVLRDHEAKDYKRFELYLNKEFPDFRFSDFDGKKRRLSEFRGKYVLLDIWGFWCPPCQKELPYLREAHKRFAGRNFEIVGLNTDEDFTIDSMKKALRDNGMLWTQAKFDSVLDVLKANLRISAFPTTFLISPEGKILSMSRAERDEPSLRGESLLKTLDEILPE